MDLSPLQIAMIGAFAVGAAALFIFGKGGSAGEKTEDLSEEEEETRELPCSVKEKKTEINYGGAVFAPDDRLLYLINFATESGEKAFEVPKEDYERLNEGDKGTLCVTGDHYVGFAKEGEEEYAQ